MSLTKLTAGVACGFLLVAPLCSAQGSIFVAADIHASSEPVSVNDMVHGWDGDFTPGEYAYADVRLNTGVRYHDWQGSSEKRWYYYLSFSEDMSVFYYNTEHGGSADKDLDLELDVDSFKADGIRLGKTFSLPVWQIHSSLAVYKVAEYQFGELDGVSLAGSGDSASATLDYHFDEDKILEYPVSDTQGYGASLDIAMTYSGLRDWNLSLQMKDIVNRWYFRDAGFTTGCINIGSSAGSTCSSSGAASGRAGQKDFYTRIPFTLMAAAELKNTGVSFSAYRHERYLRFSGEKAWDSRMGEFAVSLHSTRQLGLHWRSGWHQLSVISDDHRFSHARDLQIRLGVNFHWL